MFLGRFLGIWPRPGLRGGGALVQLQVECELAVAAWVDGEGRVSHLDGSSWWSDSWPAGSSRALGWIGEKAVVWMSETPCGADGVESGIYAMTPDGDRRLMYPTDSAVIDVVLSQE